MFCDKKNDFEKFDVNIDERIVTIYSSSSKDYPVYKNVHIKKDVYVIFDES